MIEVPSELHKFKFRRTKHLQATDIVRELELYRWHREYFQASLPNCWSLISKSIDGTTPDMIKNIFYCHAITSLKRIIAGIDYQECSQIEQIRISYFLILSMEHLHFSESNSIRSNHFLKLLHKYNISIGVLEKYALFNNLSTNYDQLKTKICEILGKANQPEIGEQILKGGVMSFPIDNRKKLAEPIQMASYKGKNMYNIDLVSTLSYFLQYPTVNYSKGMPPQV
jgi:hypothetical protein